MALACKNYSLSTTTNAGLAQLTVAISYTNCVTNSIPPGAVATLIENPVSEEDRERLRGASDVVGQNTYLTEICSRTQPVIPNDPYGIAITEIGTCEEPAVTLTPTPTPTPTPQPNRCIVSTDCGNNGIDPIDNRSYICGSPFESVAQPTGLQVFGTCTKLYGALYVANPAAAVTPAAYREWFGALPLTNKLIAITGTEFTRPLTNPTPSTGYRFVNWTPATATTNNNDVTFTANYERIADGTRYTTTVTATPSSGGTVGFVVDGVARIDTSTITSPIGTTVVIYAEETTAYTFTGWYVNNTLYSNSKTTSALVIDSTIYEARFVATQITIAPTSDVVTVVQNSTVSNTINITRTNYTGTVSLALGTLPVGVTPTITPNPTTANQFTISLVASATAQVTSTPVTVSCTATYDGTRTATTSFQLTVAPANTPTLSLSATNVTMRKSATATSTVAAVTTNLNDQQRRTTVTVTAFAPNSGANATAPAITFTDSGQLTITTTATSVPGAYTLTLRGTTVSGLTTTTTLILTILSDNVSSTPVNVPVTFTPSLTPLVFTYQRGTTVYPLPVQITATNNSSRQHTVKLDTNQQFNFIKNGITTVGTLTFILPANSSQAFAIVPLQGLFTVGGLLDGDTQFPITITDT